MYTHSYTHISTHAHTYTHHHIHNHAFIYTQNNTRSFTCSDICKHSFIFITHKAIVNSQTYLCTYTLTQIHTYNVTLRCHKRQQNENIYRHKGTPDRAPPQELTLAPLGGPLASDIPCPS